MNQLAMTTCIAQGEPALETAFTKTVGQPGEEHVFQVVREGEAGFVLCISRCTDPRQPVEGTIRVSISQVEEFQKGFNHATFELSQRHGLTSQKPRNAGQRWSDEDRRLLVAYIESRTPFEEIAETLGRTKTSIVSQVLQLDVITNDILYELLARQGGLPERHPQATAPPMSVVPDLEFGGYGGWTIPL